MTISQQDENLVAGLDTMSLFRPPIVRTAGANLDRSLFSKTIPTAAARVLDNKYISRLRVQLDKSNELLKIERLPTVHIDPDPALASRGGKCLLLKPDIRPEDLSTWSEILKEASNKEEVKVIPYELKLDYDYFQYRTYVKNTETLGLLAKGNSGNNAVDIT